MHIGLPKIGDFEKYTLLAFSHIFFFNLEKNVNNIYIIQVFIKVVNIIFVLKQYRNLNSETFVFPLTHRFFSILSVRPFKKKGKVVPRIFSSRKMRIRQQETFSYQKFAYYQAKTLACSTSARNVHCTVCYASKTLYSVLLVRNTFEQN